VNEKQPLILVSNDDGIDSPGLEAAARAAQALGEVLVVAPCRQYSGAGRSFPHSSTGVIEPRTMELDGRTQEAFCVEASPAQVILYAMLELAPRRPSLIVVGINYGENLGSDVTISGTVGAALQGASFGIPALAVSLQTPKETHLNLAQDVDFTAAAHFTHLFARRMLAVDLPFDVDVLKVDVPATATPHTPWRLTRASRHVYFRAIPPQREDVSIPARMDYEAYLDEHAVEPDSDIYALAVDRVVSVAPLSLDLTSRVDPQEVASLLREGFRSKSAG
jgi:5'-nucleotidase